MQRFFIRLSYDGTNYHGWQIQPNGITVQQRLEEALSMVTRQKIGVTGAGRTDAGVHARVMIAHFDIDLPDAADKEWCRQLAYRLNRILPRDIAVDRVYPVSEDMHARFSARKRTYHYYIHTQKNPFLRHYSCQMGFKLDFGLMQQAASYLIGQKDFKCFCKTGADVKTTICNVMEAHFDETDDGRWCFTISADRFLRNMVRAVVGTLVDVGRGRLSLPAFRAVVDGGTRSDAGESMPGNALFLWDIEY